VTDRVEVWEDVEAFRRQAERWNDLWARAPRGVPFLRAAALDAWWRTLGPGGRAFAVTVGRSEMLIGGAVFCRVRRSVGVRLAGAPFFDYRDILVDERVDRVAVTAMLLDGVLTRGTAVDLGDIPQDSPTGDALSAYARRRGLTALRLAGYACPFVDLASQLPRGARRLDAKHRRTLTKRIGAAGARIDVVCEPAAIERALPAVLDLHAARMAQKRRRTPFASGRGRTLLAALCADFAASGDAEVAAIMVDRGAAAYAVSFVSRGRYYYYLTAYDTAYESLSPGSYLLAHLIDRAQAAGCREFDLMKGDEPYKWRWSTGVQISSRWFLGGPDLPGRLKARAAFVGAAIRKRGRESRLARRIYEATGARATAV